MKALSRRCASGGEEVRLGGKLRRSNASSDRAGSGTLCSWLASYKILIYELKSPITYGVMYVHYRASLFRSHEGRMPPDCLIVDQRRRKLARAGHRGT